LIIAAALLAAIGFVVLRGDQVGAAISAVTPADGAERVSTRSAIEFEFTEAMDIATLESRFTIEPPISGTLRADGERVTFKPSTPFAAGVRYVATIRAGGQSLRNRAMTHDARTTFTTRQPRVAYLTPSQDVANLVLHDPISGQAQRVTSEQFGVYDFAISPDGARAVVSVNRDAGGERDLWLLDLESGAREQLLKCDGQVCQTASWSSDGARIAFERRPLVQRTIGKLPGPSRVWLLDVASKSAAPLFADNQRLAALPAWSPADGRIAFVDTAESTLTVVDTVSQASIKLPSNLGDPGAWSPDGATLVYPDVAPFDDRGYTQLLKADFATNVITTVFPISTSDDASVTWAPDISQIAFSRRQSGTTNVSGAQVWVAQADGARLRQITSDDARSHFRLSFSPDGALIVAQRFELGTPYAKPEVVVIPVAGGPPRVLAQDASQPVWAP
jgi:Tol biopolymer transport system component